MKPTVAIGRMEEAGTVDVGRLRGVVSGVWVHVSQHRVQWQRMAAWDMGHEV